MAKRPRFYGQSQAASAQLVPSAAAGTWHVHEASSVALKAELSALFADARNCIGDECAAYVSWADRVDPDYTHYCVFECILSVTDYRAAESFREPNRHYIQYGSLEHQHVEAVGVVKTLFPDCAAQRVLFRTGPMFEYRDDRRSEPTLWMRLGAVPLDVNEFLPRRP